MKTAKKIFMAMGFAISCNAYSDAIPYNNVGIENPVLYSFKASTSGNITAYFVSRGDAAYAETIGMLVNGISTGITGLNNQTSSYGASLILGNVNAGDNIQFYLNVMNTGKTWYSDKALNSDGANHVYSTIFNGDSYVPVGRYIGFEDISKFGDSNYPHSDFNYSDQQYVITNISQVPVPASAWFLGSSLIGLVGIARRKK